MPFPALFRAGRLKLTVVHSAAARGATTMLITQVAVSLQSLFAHEATLPLAGGTFAGLAFALFRSPVRPFGIRESESLMNFSSLGSLRCICGPSRPAGVKPDRREVCRSCGCEVVAVNETLLNRTVSREEVRKITRDLRNAAIRASRLELPPSVTSIVALQQHLLGATKLNARRTLNRQPSVVVESPHTR